MVLSISAFIATIVLMMLMRSANATRLENQEHAHEARVAELRRLAEALGFEFDERYFEGFPERHPHEWFQRRRNDSGEWASNTFRGSVVLRGVACRVTMGDHVKTEATKTWRRGKLESYVRTIPESYLLVELPFEGMPSLLIRPVGFSDKLRSDGLSGEDVEAGTRSFSERYAVKCSDPDFARALLTAAVGRSFHDANPTWMEIRHDELLVASAGQPSCWTADRFRERLEWTRHFCELWTSGATARLSPRTETHAGS